MTGALMVTGVRRLLHDTGRGFATSDRFYDTDDILLKLNEAKSRIGKILVTQPKPAWIAGARLGNLSAQIDGYAPPNFLREIAGLRSDGTFIPPAPLTLKALTQAGHDYLYAQSGLLHGPFAQVAWWSEPSQVIDRSGTTLTEFSDSVYYLIQMLAARELLPQERADAVERWQTLSGMLAEELSTFA